MKTAAKLPERNEEKTIEEKENKKHLFHVELNKEKNIIQKIEEIN